MRLAVGQMVAERAKVMAGCALKKTFSGEMVLLAQGGQELRNATPRPFFNLHLLDQALLGRWQDEAVHFSKWEDHEVHANPFFLIHWLACS